MIKQIAQINYIKKNYKFLKKYVINFFQKFDKSANKYKLHAQVMNKILVQKNKYIKIGREN